MVYENGVITLVGVREWDGVRSSHLLQVLRECTCGGSTPLHRTIRPPRPGPQRRSCGCGGGSASSVLALWRMQRHLPCARLVEKAAPPPLSCLVAELLCARLVEEAAHKTMTLTMQKEASAQRMQVRLV